MKKGKGWGKESKRKARKPKARKEKAREGEG